ncbi:DUF6970 domain-containing protein [Hymenobacter glacieicola]|uniref:DUF6970 domain-containing protein n=1 Tax=Hymenobacter glacieicola TaxID=1562124 RepID=A0ABQ1WLG3_9BACT|nr:hypothetical protein [Hymenobacter glacieicola]GGG35986.1 hypothetical protein GCM10011378_10330 [Hymenobacter glacieicola]
MKKALGTMLAATFSLVACDEIDMEKDTPSCIRQKTINLERDTPCEEGAYVKQYLFQGRIVYVFAPGNCIADGSAEVLDEECNRLGSLGGFVGNTRINGQEFSTAEFKRTIWEK